MSIIDADGLGGADAGTHAAPQAVPALGGGHIASAEDEPFVAVVSDGFELLAVCADAGHVEHNRVLLTGDVGAEEPRLDLWEERHVGDLLADLCPAVLGLPGRLHGCYPRAFRMPDGLTDPVHLRLDARRQVGERAVRAEDHE